MDLIKLAVIGCGLIGQKHLEIIAANPPCRRRNRGSIWRAILSKLHRPSG